MWLLRLLRVSAVLTPLVPATIAYQFCKLIGLGFFLVNIRARRNVLENLRRVDPSTTWLRRQFTAARVCITVVTNYYDLLRLRSVDRETVLDDVQIDGLEHVESALGAGRGAIIVSGHIGNFSVMARLPAALGLRAALIAERVEPPSLFHYMARLRSAMGIEVIPPGSSTLRRVISLLKEDGILLLAADRDVTGQGHAVLLFGERTTLPAGPVVLAMKTGAALIPAYTLRTAPHHSTVKIKPELALRRTGEWEEDIRVNMEMLARQLERMIKRDPGQWAVLQRVWPPTTSYGRSEGLGSADDALSSPDTADNCNQRISTLEY